MDEATEIWLVQVFDSQDQTIQAQGFRSQQGAAACLKDIKSQLDEQGGYTYERPKEGGYTFNATCEEADRLISVEVFKVWLHD